MEKESNFRLAEDKFCEMTDFLKDRRCSHNLELSELENYVNQNGRELLPGLLTGHLSERGVGDVGPSVLGSDGVRRTHKRIGTRKIKTLFGQIEIRRVGYSCRNIPSLFPLDAMLNLPSLNISYALQRHLILEIIKSSFDESVASVERWTGVRIPTRQAKKIVIGAARDFEEFYEHKKDEERKKATKQPLIILTCDAKGIVMRHEDLREETRRRAEKRKKKIGRRGKNAGDKKSDSKRMATVASVYETDRFVRKPEDIRREFSGKPEEKKRRPSPIAKRVWASVEKTSENTIGKMSEEAFRRCGSDKREWVAVADGDMSQIRKIRNLSRQFDKNVVIICDIIHILEYVRRAGKVLSDERKARQWVCEKSDLILRGRSSSVASGMRRSATFRKLEKSVREPVDICARYLLNHSDYLHYDKYLRSGYPIATGVIEGACRHLVKDRMGITGARWGLKGAEAVLKLRSLRVSGDFTAYWKFYEEKQYDRNYKVLYQEPSILKPSF